MKRVSVRLVPTSFRDLVRGSTILRWRRIERISVRLIAGLFCDFVCGCVPLRRRWVERISVGLVATSLCDLVCSGTLFWWRRIEGIAIRLIAGFFRGLVGGCMTWRRRIERISIRLIPCVVPCIQNSRSVSCHRSRSGAIDGRCCPSPKAAQHVHPRHAEAPFCMVALRTVCHVTSTGICRCASKVYR